MAEPGDTSAPLWYEAFCSSAETFGQNPAGGSLRFLMNERMSGQAIQVTLSASSASDGPTPDV